MPRFCMQCGSPMQEGHKFCLNCGAPAAPVAPVQAPVAAPQPVVEAAAPVVEAAAPVVEAAAPVVEAAAPVVEEAPAEPKDCVVVIAELKDAAALEDMANAKHAEGYRLVAAVPNGVSNKATLFFEKK